MSRHVAILGLGARGARWADAYHRSGWLVSCFDPEPSAGAFLSSHDDVRREGTISAAVKGADWIVCCLPERLELLRMVLQRAQVEARSQTIIVVATRDLDVEDIQACTLRPAQVVRVTEAEDGTLSLDVTDRNDDALRDDAQQVLAELSAALSLAPREAEQAYDDAGAESA
ncbi:MAG: 3-hydroxyacyl-CoA dehydrogenase NAD-binding domain-containing protein [Pseudomonadota bacterium]